MAYGLDPLTDFGPAPLERYRAGLGEYLDAIADEVQQTNPVPSLFRWYRRQRNERGDMGAVGDLLGRLSGAGETFTEGFRALGVPETFLGPKSPPLPREEVARRAKEVGLTLDRPMTEETLESIVAERRRRLAQQLVFDRAEMGTSGQALGVLTELLLTAADPLNAASAFIPFTRAPLLAARLAQISQPGLRRAATGAIEGALGNLAVEPFVALAALDEDPQYGAVNWLLTAAFGAGLGSGLHWLTGAFRRPERAIDIRTEGAIGAPERAPEAVAQRAEAPAAVAPPEAPQRVPAAPEGVVAAAADISTKVPQETARLVDAAHPETRDAAAQVAMAQVLGADRRPDVAWLFEADNRFVAARAAYAEETRFRQELRVSVEEIRERQRLQESELARLRAETFRFTPPEDFKPSKAALAEAKALKAGRAPGRRVKEPQSLAEFVRDKGGISTTDTLAGDLRANDLQRAGLLRLRREGGVQKDGSKKRLGRSADEIGEAAWQEGFYTERPTAEQLIADLIDDASGARKTYADLDQLQKWDARRQEEKAYDDWLDSLDATGLDIAKYDDRTLAYILTLDPARQKVLALEEALAAGKLSEAEGLDVAARLDAELAAAQADTIAEARQYLDQQSAGSSPAVEFVTAKGSLYTIDGNTTVRNKAQRAEHGDDAGLKEQSALTVYVSSADKEALGVKGLQAKWRIAVIGDQIALSTWNEAQGRWGLSPTARVGYQTEPAVGLHPVEVWFGEAGPANSTLYKKVHVGNEITEIRSARPEGFEADLEARAADDYTPLTREEFDAVDTHLRRLEERGELDPHVVAEPEAGRAGEGRLAEGLADQSEPAALAAQFPEARISTEARIDPETLAAFQRRQDDIANDLHADVAASREAEALVLERDKADALAEAAEAEALARPLLTEADKAAIAESDARYKDEKAMLDAFAACRLGAGGA